MAENQGYPETENAEDREIVLNRSFNAPRELVWEAWSRPEHLANWWGRGDSRSLRSNSISSRGAYGNLRCTALTASPFRIKSCSSRCKSRSGSSMRRATEKRKARGSFKRRLRSGKTTAELRSRCGCCSKRPRNAITPSENTERSRAASKRWTGLRNCSPCLPETNAKKQRMNDSFAGFFRFYAGLGKAWLDFVQSKPVFSQNTSSSLDFVQSGGGFSAFSPKFHVSRWIKSTLANGFFLFRFLDWTKSSIGLPPLELSSFLRSLSFCNRSIAR